MATTAHIDVKALGKAKRSYDKMMSEDARVEEVLDWYSGDELSDVGIAHRLDAKKMASSMLQNRYIYNSAKDAEKRAKESQAGVFDYGIGLANDLYYEIRDLFDGRRAKITSTIIGGTLLGAGIGAVIGFVVVPFLGEIPGVVGGAIAGGVVAVGGAIGITIIGAVAGHFLGRFTANKVFKDEKRTQLSHRSTDKLKKQKIDYNTAKMIQSYLINRRKTYPKDHPCHDTYKYLYKLGIKKGDSVYINQICLFFAKELELLQKEPQSPEIQAEIEGVIYMMNALKHSKASRQSKMYMQQAIEQYAQSYPDEVRLAESPVQSPSRPRGTSPLASSAPVVKPAMINPSATTTAPMTFLPARDQVAHRGVQYPTVSALSHQQMRELGGQFEQQFGQRYPQYQLVSKDRSSLQAGGPLEIRHKVVRDDKELAKLIFQQRQEANQHYSAGVYVDKTPIQNKSSQDKDAIAKMIVLQANIYHQQKPDQQPVILAGGDKLFAIGLMTEALKAGFVPQLLAEEFPNEADRQEILHQAQIQAGVSDPQVGQRTTLDRGGKSR